MLWHQSTLNCKIMNWTIDRISDCSSMTAVEEQAGSRRLNSHTMIVINNKNDFHSVVYRNNCNGSVITLQCLHQVRAQSVTTLLPLFDGILTEQRAMRRHSPLLRFEKNAQWLGAELLIVLKSRSQHLSERGPCANVKMRRSKTQIMILTTS